MNRFNFTFYDANGAEVEAYGADRDTMDSCRRVLLLPPGEGKAYKRQVLGDTWDAVQIAGGKPPHILPCDAVRVHVTGSWQYEAFYRISPLEWADIVEIPVPAGRFGDYEGQPWQFYRRLMQKPWTPTRGIYSTLPWFGYALAETPPVGMLFPTLQDFCHDLVKSQEAVNTGSLILLYGMQFALIVKEKA